MKAKIYVFFAIVFLVLLFIGQQARTEDSQSAREYQIKAAFLYNFLMFVDWPKEKMSDDKEPIVLGIIGKDPFGNAFEPLRDKQAKDRKVIVQRFKGFEELKKDAAELNQTTESIRKCHLLFICSSEEKVLQEIIGSIKNHSVLTVGDMQTFRESDGMIINLLMEEGKIRFKINVTVAKEEKLRVSSQLLRLAKEVVGEWSPQ
jgi:hypothetical protein